MHKFVTVTPEHVARQMVLGLVQRLHEAAQTELDAARDTKDIIAVARHIGAASAYQRAVADALAVHKEL